MKTIPFAQAKELCSDPLSGFTHVSGEQHISLPPRFLGRVGEGIRTQLDSEIGFFSERFNGVPIAYSNIRLRGNKGQILDDLPFIHFVIQADFVLFKPCVDSQLQGVVNKVGKDHVGLLMHGNFNVSIPLCQYKGGQAEATPSKGDLQEFTVTEVHLHRNLLSLKGKIEHS